MFSKEVIPTGTLNKEAKIKRIGVLLWVSMLIACAPQPTLQTGESAEVIGDNLYKVDNTTAEAAYVDPDVDFSRYRKIILAPLVLDNVEIVQPSHSRKKWELTDKDKERVSDIYQSSMEKYLPDPNEDSNGFELVTLPGEDVLRVTTMLLGIAPAAPKDDFKSRPMGRSRIFTRSAGTLTIALVIQDAKTGKQLVNIVDSSDGWGRGRENNRVTNLADVKLMFANWANKLRHGLDNMAQLQQ